MRGDKQGRSEKVCEGGKERAKEEEREEDERIA